MDGTFVRRGNAQHYQWGGNCDGWYLLREPELNVIEERMPPGASETLHFHKKAQQFFYVLEGEAVLEIAAKEVCLAGGDGLHIRPGTPHRIRNASDRDVRFLVISQPPSQRDRFELASVDPSS